MQLNISKRWIFLWICLIILNLIMRIPLTPHEIGHDSFLIHFVADSISTYGHAKWWLNPLSIAGLYPFSMASAMPFYLSGVSQSLSLGMEQTIWYALVALGILSVFTAYLMAGAIKNDKNFKFITALVYSLSPGILVYTTWNATGRGLFLVLLPLFIYFLVKSRYSELKYSLFTVVLLILLFVTHNLVYFLVPILFAFVISLIINKIQFKSSIFFGGFVLIILFIILFMQFSVKDVTIISIIYNYMRYIGVVGILAIGGFISILFKKNKTFEENFILLGLLFFTPFMGILLYSKFFILPFLSLLVSYGFLNMIKITKNRNIAFFFIIIILLTSIGMAEFYQFGRSNIEEQKQYIQYSAEESTVNAALWTKSYINKMSYADDTVLSRRILAYSGAIMLGESNIVYPVQDNLEGFNTTMRSPFSPVFYSEGPYEAKNITGITVWVWTKLGIEGLDSIRWGFLAEAYGVNYYIQNERIVTVFSSSSKLKENAKIFDNGGVGIWNLND